MGKYIKGQKVTVTNSEGQKVTWVASGDEQRDAAISIQVSAAAECLTWKYGSVDIDNHIIDCSGLTSYLYELTDTYIGGNNSYNQYNNGTNNLNCQNIYTSSDGDFLKEFDLENLQTGDIITFEYSVGAGGGHVAYYLGDGYFIHAANSSDDVIIGTFSSEEYGGETFITDEGMEVTGAGNYWGNHVIYVSHFDNNIYVDKNNEVYHTISGEDKSFYRPVDKIGDKIIYELVDKNNQVKEKGFFNGNEFVSYTLAITESVNATNLPQHEKDRIIEQMIKVFVRNKILIETVDFDPVEVFGKFDETTRSITSNDIIKKIVSGTKNTTTQASNTVYDPLILDLDGDGYNVETKENGTNFDLDKNGFAEKINWTKKDGFLCLDLNGNGTIDNGGELFGDKTLLADGTTAKNGFEALAQYDGNGDGVIDENEIILKFIINKQLSVGKFSLYSFALLKNMGALLKSAWLNDRLCHN